MSELKDLVIKLHDKICELDEKEDYKFSENIAEEYEGNITLSADKGYGDNVDILCHMQNTGNGFIAFFPAYNKAYQDNYICMDYSEAEYLRKLLNYENKKNHKV